MPEFTNAKTARELKKKIHICNKFILIATDAAIESKWCNWELGIGDALKQANNKLYVFFEVVPKPIPVYSEDRKVLEIPFLNYHHNRLCGKVYKADDNAKSLIIAFERNSETGKADLEEVRDNIATSISGGSIDTPIQLEP